MQWGYTPFLRAIEKGHVEVARFLLRSGSVFNEKDKVSAVKPVWVHVSFYYIVDSLSHLLIVSESVCVHVNGGVFAWVVSE